LEIFWGDWEGISFQEMQGLIQSNPDSCGMKILPYGRHLRNSSSGIHIERTGHPLKGDSHRHQQQSMQPISRLQLLGGGVGIHPIKPNPSDNKLYGITYNLLAKLRVFHKTRILVCRMYLHGGKLNQVTILRSHWGIIGTIVD
jgi:hypothetical protein